jgi:hypothetical protein
MIQANELRVNNWVILDWDGDKRPQQIDGINFPYVYIAEWEDNFKLDDCHPIPLTPEILEKCGFEWETDKKRHLQIFIDDVKTKTLGFYFANGVIDHTQLYNNGSQDNFHFAPLKSAHQLQNLYFALTGQELTVNL